MSTILSGDVGGTNTRLKLIEFNSNTSTFGDTIYIKYYRNYDYLNFTDILNIFLDEAKIQKSNISAAGFAVAGPIIDGTVKFTNLPWILEEKAIKSFLANDKVGLTNDFQGIGYGLETLNPSDVHVLQDGKSREKANKALIGAGTGLGIGFITYIGDKYIVSATEGGHVDFAPVDDVQVELLRYMRKKYHRVSVERLLSGQGLAHIYRFVQDSSVYNERENAELRHIINSGGDAAAAISKFAIEEGDPIAARALDIFVRIYGAAAGNLALSTLPRETPTRNV